MLLSHVAEEGMDERIREVGNAGKIKNDRFQAIPDTFDPESTELVGKVPISEKVAKFGEHVEFQFHKSDTLRGTRWCPFLRLPVGYCAPVPARPQSKFRRLSATRGSNRPHRESDALELLPPSSA